MQDPRVSRRQLLRLAVMGAVGLVVSTRARPAGGAPSGGAARRDPDAILRDLLDGNRRFAGGQAAGPRRKPEDFATLAAGQTPDALIVGCADSRVSPEILFDLDVQAAREAAGLGLAFGRTESLNTSPALIGALADLVRATAARLRI